MDSAAILRSEYRIEAGLKNIQSRQTKRFQSSTDRARYSLVHENLDVVVAPICCLDKGIIHCHKQQI